MVEPRYASWILFFSSSRSDAWQNNSSHAKFPWLWSDFPFILVNDTFCFFFFPFQLLDNCSSCGFLIKTMTSAKINLPEMVPLSLKSELWKHEGKFNCKEEKEGYLSPSCGLYFNCITFISVQEVVSLCNTFKLLKRKEKQNWILKLVILHNLAILQ